MKEINFSDVRDGGLGPGEYDMEIFRVEESESSTGNECLDIHFRGADGDGYHFERIPLVQQSLWKLKRLCAAAGLDVDGNYNVSDLKQDLIGAPVHVVLETQTWEGEERSRARSFSPVK